MKEVSPVDFFEPIIPYIKSFDPHTGFIEIKAFDNIKIDRNTVISYVDDATLNYTRGAVCPILSGTIIDESIIQLLDKLIEESANRRL